MKQLKSELLLYVRAENQIFEIHKNSYHLI